MASKSPYSDRANRFFDKDKTRSDKNSRLEPVFRLKVSEEEKYKNDCQWFKDYADYIVPPHSSVIDDYKEMKLAYEVINNNLEGFKDQLDRFLNPLGENIGAIEETILPYPRLHNAVNMWKGELLSRKDKHQIVLLSAKAVKDKNDALVERLMASVEEDVQLAIEKNKQQLQGMSEAEANQFIEELRTQETPEDIMDKDWMSDQELFYAKALKYCMFDQDVELKRMETAEDVAVSDRMFIFSGWKHGKPYFELRNTMYTGFLKAPNEFFVNKGDYVWYRKPITIADVYNGYPELKQEELESLGIHTYGNNNRIDKRHALGTPDSTYVYDHNNYDMIRNSDDVDNGYDDKTVGMHQGQGVNRRYTEEDLIWETHIEYKAYRALWFLEYTDDFNKKVTTILPDKFKVPSHAEKNEFTNRYGNKSFKWTWYDDIDGNQYSAERIWLPRKYEVIRLGSDVYPQCREVPFQFTDIEEPYSRFNLSTFGAIFSSRNAKSVSMIQRAIPVYFQYIYIKHIQNKEMAKYQGYVQSIDVDQIPDELGQDIYGNKIRDKLSTYLAYLKRTNKDIYSGTQTTLGGLPPSTRSPGSTGYMLGTAVELMNLQQLLELVDREMMMAMGISPQRMSMFDTNSNVADNQVAIAQSHHTTEPYHYMHSIVWKEALNDWLINFRTYCENIFRQNPEMKEHSLHYILPDGTSELLRVTPEILSHTSIGLYVTDSTTSQKYLDTMENLSMNFAMNSAEHGLEAISALTKAISTGASPTEVHRMIQLEGKRQEERQRKAQEAQMQADQAAMDSANRNREDLQEHEKEKIVLKEAEQTVREVTVAQVKNEGEITKQLVVDANKPESGNSQ